MNREGVAKFLGAIAILCGTIIGVGLFGLPYVAAQAGFGVVVLYLAWGTFAALTAALIFGEVMYRTKSEHRLPGYVAAYLGKTWGRWVTVSALTGLFGAQLAYLVVGGHFLTELLKPLLPLPEAASALAYATVGAVLIAGGGRLLARTELALLPLFLGVMAFIILQALPFWTPAALSTLNLPQAVLPYGVVMFSLWGLSAVGECREYLGRRYARLLKPALVTSFILCAVAYGIFTAAILGATGSRTSPDALNGLRGVLGPRIVAWFYFFGVLTTFTSYISFGLTLKKIFRYDTRWPEFLAWVAAVTVPPLLYIAGVTNFIAIMGFVGAVTLGFDTISLLFTYRVAAGRPSRVYLPYRLALPAGATYVLVTLFGAGIVTTLWHFILTS